MQVLKWVLQTKRDHLSNQKVRHHARLVSCLVSYSNMCVIHFSVTGNAPTIYKSTKRILLSVMPTWEFELRKVGDRLVIRVSDVKKAWLHVNQSQSLIIYNPHRVIRNVFQVPAPLLEGCRETVCRRQSWPVLAPNFIPWLPQNILQLKRACKTPHLSLKCPSCHHHHMKGWNLLGNAPILSDEKTKIQNAFKCQESQEPTT